MWQTPNQLLRVVNQDIEVPEYVAGCKALGLVNKIVTGPLWRVLESDVSILDMNDRFQTLVTHLDLWALVATDVLSGEAILFPDFPPSEDVTWQHLIVPSELVLVILQTLFHAFSALVARLVDDHLPGGKYDEPTSQLHVQTASEDIELSSSHQDLVGKRVSHKWVDEDGKGEWYCGHILSLVP